MICHQLCLSRSRLCHFALGGQPFALRRLCGAALCGAGAEAGAATGCCHGGGGERTGQLECLGMGILFQQPLDCRQAGKQLVGSSRLAERLGSKCSGVGRQFSRDV